MAAKKNSKEVRVLMVGIGGYGRYYLKTLFNKFPKGKVTVTGIIDPRAEQYSIFRKIKRLHIPFFSSIEDFYDRGFAADLTVISSPIHYHVPQSCAALKWGSNVLCDKPIGATVQEADELIRVRDESGKWVRIGYQWSYSKSIQLLKNDIMQGLFGKPIRLKTLYLWPRDDLYYKRNDWAGKIIDDFGRWILDSPVNNALAHFLHNMFYVLGDKIETSAIPKQVKAECYRANPIENYDTAACRIFTTGGVELLFYASHATKNEIGPIFKFEFENAVVCFDESLKKIIATDKKGNNKDYGSPEDSFQFLKLLRAVAACSNPESVICGPEAARSHTLCVNGVQESAQEIVSFPKAVINREKRNKRWWVTDLDYALIDCYEKNMLPFEKNISWTIKGKTIDLSDYEFFPGGTKAED